MTNLSPPPYQIIPLRSLPGLPGQYPVQTLTFEVVSEDLQSKPLQAVVLLDFRGFGVPDTPTRLWGTGNIPPGHLNSAPRDAIKADIPFLGVGPGCHSATLIVSHEFTDIGATKVTPKDESDVATATWWFDIDDDPGRPDLLTSCVVRGGTTADAGSDGEAGSP